MKKIKSILMSENGMKIVNALFLLSILIRNTKSKAMQISWVVLITFAVVMICVNIYFYCISR